ncbi:glutathione peroxidase [Pontibacter sp. MBLB2868]|uniref:glutathione peroxidase n=1 Tax=Pontibacter sp. MBLB2868 TaxID=3451555 RepID=UPI003F74BE7A
MKSIFKLLGLSLVLGITVSCSGTANNKTSDNAMATETTANANTSGTDFYSFKVEALDGQEIDFSKYKGKKVLLVNTASECGFTPQYAGLQELHEKHGDEVVILGFPANNFGGQEPGSNEEIATFCQRNYGVAFQMFDKISVKGEDKHPLYTWLAAHAPNHEEPSWNFCKYLVDENGNVVAFFPSKVKPMDEEILAAIQK